MKDEIESTYDRDYFSDDSFCFVERPWLGEGLQIEIVQPKQMLINNLKLKKMKKLKKDSSAGTTVDSSTNTDVSSVSQPIAKPNVVCSPSKLILNQSEFNHDVVRSTYNSNFYDHKKLGYTVHEICHEDYDFQEFYLIEEDGQKIFLGCSTEGFGNSDNVSIDFKIFYT